jgi:hypothetical protein
MTEVNEQARTYWFSQTEHIRIENIVGFADSTTTHRLETKDGRKWIVPKNFMAIEIEVANWTL